MPESVSEKSGLFSISGEGQTLRWYLNCSWVIQRNQEWASVGSGVMGKKDHMVECRELREAESEINFYRVILMYLISLDRTVIYDWWDSLLLLIQVRNVWLLLLFF